MTNALEASFEYVIKGSGRSALFDIRSSVCQNVGGACHGDVVLTEDGCLELYPNSWSNSSATFVVISGDGSSFEAIFS